MANNPRFSNTLQALADAQNTQAITQAQPSGTGTPWFKLKAELDNAQTTKVAALTQGLGFLATAGKDHLLGTTLAKRNLAEEYNIYSGRALAEDKYGIQRSGIQAQTDADEAVNLLKGDLANKVAKMGLNDVAAATTYLDAIVKLQESQTKRETGAGVIRGKRDVTENLKEIAKNEK